MKKLTEQEFAEVKSLRETIVEIITTVGELSLNKRVIEGDLAVQYSKFADFQEKERVLFETLRNKYGAGNIDTETGEVTE